MKKNNIIPKSIASALLTLMFHMLFCSAFCAAGVRGCCGKEVNDKNLCNKSCCKHEKDADGKGHDCQDMHFAFFNTIGKFSQINTAFSFKSFCPLFILATPIFIFKPICENENTFACDFEVHRGCAVTHYIGQTRLSL